jgi:hypothetical protein
MQLFISKQFFLFEKQHFNNLKNKNKKKIKRMKENTVETEDFFLQNSCEN